jgi:hypothetical protein
MPMSQLPAIFLQQAISESVMLGVGRQDSRGAAANSAASTNRIGQRKLTNKAYSFDDAG